MQKTEHLSEVISDKLRQLREGDDRTQRELAADCDIPLAVLNRALTGVSTPSPDALVKLAVFYEVSVDWLLGLTDKKPRRKRQHAG